MNTTNRIRPIVQTHQGFTRDEIEAIRTQHPIEQVIAMYTDLRRYGRMLNGRCPLPDHDDRDPSFVVYTDGQTFYCFGCNCGGDVFAFLQLVEHLNFRDAIARLEGAAFRSQRDVAVPILRSGAPSLKTKKNKDEMSSLNPSEEHIQLLTAAASVYHASLLTNREMLEYVLGRGITLETIKRFRLGYATGENLAKYFRFRHWNLQAARELGFVNDHGEFFQKRIIIPELRNMQAIYLTGRKTVEFQRVKYLGLPGTPKPLCGLEMARSSRDVFLCEGAFDMLTLVQWGYPALALLGSHLKAEWVDELAFAERIFIMTDSDEPGRAAAQKLAEIFRERAIIVPPLPQVKDVNELATQPDGQEVFARLVAQARASLTRSGR